jgi:hypothetical protein
LRKKRFAAAASRRALSRKSMVWPRLSVQVHPAAFDLQIGLVDPPRAGGRAQMRPHPLLQLRRVGLDPAVDGCMVDRHASVPQHEFQVTVRDRELQVPAHRPQDHFRRELPALERTLPPCHSQYAPAVSNPALLPDQPAAANLATEPASLPLPPPCNTLPRARTVMKSQPHEGQHSVVDPISVDVHGRLPQSNRTAIMRHVPPSPQSLPPAVLSGWLQPRCRSPAS